MTGALAGTLQAFFGTPNVRLTADSIVTGTTHHFGSVRDLEREVVNGPEFILGVSITIIRSCRDLCLGTRLPITWLITFSKA